MKISILCKAFKFNYYKYNCTVSTACAINALFHFLKNILIGQLYYIGIRNFIFAYLLNCLIINKNCCNFV